MNSSWSRLEAVKDLRLIARSKHHAHIIQLELCEVCDGGTGTRSGGGRKVSGLAQRTDARVLKAKRRPSHRQHKLLELGWDSGTSPPGRRGWRIHTRTTIGHHGTNLIGLVAKAAIYNLILSRSRRSSC